MVSRRSWMSLGFFVGLTGLVVLMAWLNRDRMYPVEVGTAAPSFSAFDLEGEPVSLEDYRGKVVLLNIWATWCTPCKAEMPSIQRLYEEIGDEDFEVLAVSIDRAPADDDRTNPLSGELLEFTQSMGLTFPILHDPEGTIATTFQTTGVPESFVLNRDGIIMKKITGPMEWDAGQNVEFIERLVEGRAAS